MEAAAAAPLALRQPMAGSFQPSALTFLATSGCRSCQWLPSGGPWPACVQMVSLDVPGGAEYSLRLLLPLHARHGWHHLRNLCFNPCALLVLLTLLLELPPCRQCQGGGLDAQHSGSGAARAGELS